ncbi:uclacyanin-3 [Phtheirospermum japonicum]|uniref:Uclacyanin-3 n=1 Tax=Phtheirospermum japonicum TaxID=374723 RepID=A0A830C2H4_9LAMI|nr:uclacyanin-3 [Phtheirospermum japonicum]
MAKVIAFLALLLISPAAYAVDYTVGGPSGWTTGVDYTAWASGQTFTTNDTLVFNYGPTHAVDIVEDADDYRDCDTDSPRSSYTVSPTRIALNTTGPWYFICPRGNHCQNGQRLAINVTAAGTTPPGGSPPPAGGSVPPTPPGTPPATPGTPSGTPPATPGTPPSTATPPPAPSAAAGLEVGLISLVMAAVVGLMG